MKTSKPSFPCESVPEDGHEARLLGLYDQPQKGLLMQRLKIPGGRLTLEQWKRLAELAVRFTPNMPLHLTTRQDIEFHSLDPVDVPALQREISRIGLATTGACGDTLRNITVCASAEACDGRFDLAPLAAYLREALEAPPFVWELPRKFKISLSGCKKSCARPWINDLGLVANDNGTFQAIVAGSLGARPNTGILCYEELNADEILTLAFAALRLFYAEGDRKTRTKARLRHVRERLGDQVFREKLDKVFLKEKWTPSPTRKSPGAIRRDPGSFRFTRLSMPRGDVDPSTVLQLVEALSPVAGLLYVGLDHDLVFHGIAPNDLPPEIRNLVAKLRVIACPGAELCVRALVKTGGVADAIRDIQPAPNDLMIGIAGCPNNCSQSAVADIGLIGRVKTVDGKRCPGFRILTGGGQGKTAVLAEETCEFVPVERAAEAVADLLKGR